MDAATTTVTAICGDGTAEIGDLLARVSPRHRWAHPEKLRRFDGADGFAKARGDA